MADPRLTDQASIPAVISATPAFSFNTPWIEVQTYEKAATLVAQVIGDDATISWIQGQPTLGEKLDQALQQKPQLANDAAKRQQIKQDLLQRINAL